MSLILSFMSLSSVCHIDKLSVHSPFKLITVTSPRIDMLTRTVTLQIGLNGPEMA